MNNDHLIVIGGKYCQSTGDWLGSPGCESGNNTHMSWNIMAIYPDKSENVTREKNTTSKTSSACKPNVTPAAGSAVQAGPILAYSVIVSVAAYQYLYISI